MSAISTTRRMTLKEQLLRLQGKGIEQDQQDRFEGVGDREIFLKYDKKEIGRETAKELSNMQELLDSCDDWTEFDGGRFVYVYAKTTPQEVAKARAIRSFELSTGRQVQAIESFRMRGSVRVELLPKKNRQNPGLH